MLLVSNDFCSTTLPALGLPHMKLDQDVDSNIENKKEILNHMTKQLYKCTQT